MRIEPRGWLFVLLLLFACNAQDEETPAPPTTVASPVPTATESVPTATSPNRVTIPSATPTIPPTLNELSLSIEHRCPEQPVVSFEDLDSTPYQLLTTSVQEGNRDWQLWGTGSKPSPFTIPTEIQGDYSLAAISPDQKFLAFYEVIENESGLNLWVLSNDGQKQWLAAHLNQYETIRWVNEFRMIIVRLQPKEHWPTLIGSLDPFSRVSEPTPLVGLWYSVFAFTSDGTEMIYLRPDGSWQLLNLTTGDAQSVFSSFPSSRIQLPIDASVTWTPNKAAHVVLWESRSIQLFIAENPPGSEAVYKLLFPSQATWWWTGWWSTDGQLMASVRILGSAENDPQVGPKQFYILDTSHFVLYDYCLAEAEYPSNIAASEDNRFLAWQAVNQNGLKGTLVLELATGRRAWLSDVKVLGWLNFED